jgi:hypothetical protein
MRPTTMAARAEPAVNKALGSPARLVVPSISWARRAPTVTPAARPAPLRICGDAAPGALGWVQAVVGGGDGLGDQGLDAAEAGRDGEQAQPVHHGGGLVGVRVHDGAEHAAPAAHLRVHDALLLAGGQPRVVDTGHARVRLKEGGDRGGGVVLRADSHGQGTEGAGEEERGLGGDVLAKVLAPPHHRGKVFGRAGQDAGGQVGVPAEVLGRRMHDQVRTVGERVLVDGGGEGVATTVSAPTARAWAGMAAMSKTVRVGLAGVSKNTIQVRPLSTSGSRSTSSARRNVVVMPTCGRLSPSSSKVPP